MSPKPKPPPELHELEAEVMENVWSRDAEVAVRDVMQALNRRTKKPRAYTTYMTILGRLHAKGLVTRRREGKTDFYKPSYTREEYADLHAHENHHRSTRDPLRLACARVLSQALFFLPALRPLGDRYSELAEQRADEAAILGAGGAAASLASALLAFEAGAPAGSAGISPERVDSLLGKSTRRQLPTGLIGLSLAAVSLLIVLVWRASAVASADATFNLPLVSSQPCMLVLALLPALICFGSIAGRRLLRTPARVAV